MPRSPPPPPQGAGWVTPPFRHSQRGCCRQPAQCAQNLPWGPSGLKPGSHAQRCLALPADLSDPGPCTQPAPSAQREPWYGPACLAGLLGAFGRGPTGAKGTRAVGHFGSAPAHRWGEEGSGRGTRLALGGIRALPASRGVGEMASPGLARKAALCTHSLPEAAPRLPTLGCHVSREAGKEKHRAEPA